MISLNERRLTLFKLFHHDVAGGHGHVVRGVLLRISWGDDGHEVVPVARGHLQGIIKKKNYSVALNPTV